jgi:superfamily II DNA/RNA helicase
LDVKGVSHVFNFDTPWHPDDYVHRIGRTGRAGATGRAFTFVTPEDAEAVQNVEKLTGGAIPVFAIESGAPEAEREPAAEAPRRDRKGRKPREQERDSRSSARREAVDEPRAEQEPRAERKSPAERKPSAEHPVRRERRASHEPADEGWNGPVPEFLKQSALA